MVYALNVDTSTRNSDDLKGRSSVSIDYLDVKDPYSWTVIRTHEDWGGLYNATGKLVDEGHHYAEAEYPYYLGRNGFKIMRDDGSELDFLCLLNDFGPELNLSMWDMNFCPNTIQVIFDLIGTPKGVDFT